MPRLQAWIATPTASRSLTRLCRHFRHKIDVEYDEQKADARFPFGHCLMEATSEHLHLRCQAPDDASMARLQYVLDDHLRRFSREPDMVFDWREWPEH